MYRGDGDKTPSGFKRRVYKLTSDPRFILIHYLNVDEKHKVNEKKVDKSKKKEKEEAIDTSQARPTISNTEPSEYNKIDKRLVKSYVQHYEKAS